MINIFQIFHTFSEHLVAGWVLISDWLTHFLTTGVPAQGSWSTIFKSFILSANNWSLVEIWFLTGWHTFWLLGLQRKDHDQPFSIPSFFQRTIGRWLRFDFWLVDTLSDYWDSSARIMIKHFQILHSFSEKLVAGWVSTGELRPIFFQWKWKQITRQLTSIRSCWFFFGQWGRQCKYKIRWSLVRLIFHKQSAAKVGLDGRIQLNGFREERVSLCCSVLSECVFQHCLVY